MFHKGQELYHLAEWSQAMCLICHSSALVYSLCCFLVVQLSLMLQKLACHFNKYSQAFTALTGPFLNLNIPFVTQVF